MLGKLIDDLLDRPASARQVPDNFLEILTALAVRRAVLDQMLVIIELRSGIVEVECVGLWRRCIETRQ